MNIFDNNIHLSENRSSSFSAFLIFTLALVGFNIGGIILGSLLALPFFEGDLSEFPNALANPSQYEGMKLIVYITQGTATIVGTILIPWIYLKLIEKKSLAIFFQKKFNPLILMLVALIVLVFMGVNSIAIEWNASMHLPEFLSGLEKSFRMLEDKAAEMTAYITTFDHPGQFLLAFTVVAILPAFGEELLFRGFLQNLFQNISKNIHVAIWISAFLFSAMHMQFFGFLPRMLLGALFGYLYYWSGNLWVPIVAHLVNNGFTLIMVYLYQLQVINQDISNTESTPLYSALIFAIITAGLLFYFRKYFLKARTT